MEWLKIAPRQLLLGNCSMRYLTTTTTDGGSADIASLHGKDCSYNPIAFPPSMEVRCNLVGQCRSNYLPVRPVNMRCPTTTTTDGGSADIAGAIICPYIL